MKLQNKPTKKQLDKMWAEVVKLKADNKCEVCGKKEYLNSHHIYSRSNHAVRWDSENGCCLCSGHHTLKSDFSAHKTPFEFTEFIKRKRGDKWFKNLQLRANTVSKPDYRAWYLLLKQEYDIQRNPRSTK